jgi:hypothetical protein
MEEVLDVYKRPYDPRAPLICLDETSKQLIEETRPVVPAAPGQPERRDYEYRRHGVANLFMMVEPLTGNCQVTVTERRTKVDWADEIRRIVDERYPAADRIVLVLDNLNTHTKASLYEAFEPAEAKRLADQLEIHYTPKHGSWLNVAECELSILSRQCLAQRMGDMETLTHQVGMWQTHRSHNPTPVNWRFTTEDARIKLKRLYPSLQS